MSFGKFTDDKDKAATTPNGSMTASPLNPGQVEAFLGKGSKVVGTVSFNGPADIDGFIEGEINARERLTIGEGAVVNARVNGTEIVIKGTVTGDIVATKRLSLKKPARITGNITSANLSVEEGVIFEGKCAMANATGAESKPAAAKTPGSEKIGASA